MVFGSLRPFSINQTQQKETGERGKERGKIPLENLSCGGLSGTVFCPVVPFSSFPVFSPKTQESPAVCSVLSAGAILSGDPGGHKLPVYPVFALLCSYPCAVVFVPLCFPRFDLVPVLFLILPLLGLGGLILASLYQFLFSLCGSRRLLCPPARQSREAQSVIKLDLLVILHCHPGGIDKGVISAEFFKLCRSKA